PRVPGPEVVVMRSAALATLTLAVLILAVPLVGSSPSVHLPWKAAGFTEREAAAHLLNRFAFGPRPGEVDSIVKMGLDRWSERQLASGLSDRNLDERLEKLPALEMSASQLARTYPPPGMLLAEARRAGVIDGDLEPESEEAGEIDKRERREAVMRWASRQGYRSQRELAGQLLTQKLWRAVDSENQLAEVMTDFWFNHFNVSMTDNQSRGYLLSYERDAIRPNALGRMRDLLGATAKHPAMLLYLDNAQSIANEGSTTTLESEMEGLRRRRSGALGRPDMQRKRPRGLNENYARELLELHTLGVDGGYTQEDVVEVARAFTGWTVLPPGPRREEAERRLARVRQSGRLGFSREGEFLFRADAHDAGAKTVLGSRLPAGRGIEDGEQVLDLLAVHPSTAKHVATKLAVRFVSDKPPQALVDRLAAVYLKSGGQVRPVLVAIAESPEFWSRDAVGAKIKSPFELAASALRGLGAEVVEPRDTLRWIADMGQRLYAYQAPTGYPDRAEAWVNTGSLLNRMNFGLQLAAGRVRGVDFDLAALNGGREPGSRDEALKTYAARLLPGRDLEPALALLQPMVNDPDLAKKVEQSTAVEQVVGVILGSPEFQRR
ncbi:MAG TPA: DUF1800 domain-containing protein, partial [Thermoanaerobaculia bacterium]|nr:DUF1800 domain-containing protein [Thermoanaerobaculia bacterium]